MCISAPPDLANVHPLALRLFTQNMVALNPNFLSVKGLRAFGGFLVSKGKRVLSWDIRGVFAKLAGDSYTLLLQSLTGNSRILESRT